jgi:endoglucanase
MRTNSLNFLKKIVETPSPSGFEMRAAKVFRGYVAPFCRKVETDVMGNTYGILGKKNARPRVMLAGHMDELGLMITYIDDKGFLYYKAVGGIDPHTVPGSRVQIHTKKGDVFGILGRKAIHVIEAKDREKVTPHYQNFIDIGAKDKKAADKIVEKGDVGTFDVGFARLRGDIYTSRAFDDKMGAWAVAEVLRILAGKKSRLKAQVFGCATVQEEVGLRGATTGTYGIDPDVGICLEVGFANDHPGGDPKRFGDAKLGEGPVITRGANINHALFNLFVKTAKKNKIPYQVEAIPGRTGTDTNVMQLTRAGVATMLISVPLRYMHTQVETLSLKDLENAAELVAAVILELTPKTNFIPR